MLTREQAKTKGCPYQVALSFEISLKNLAAGVPEKELKERLEKVCHCKAEDCPKWRDSFVVSNSGHKFTCGQEGCEHFHSYSVTIEINHCNKCKNRYGYCGG